MENIILIADDNPGDRFMLKKAFEENKPAFKLMFSKNGEELLAQLNDIYVRTKNLPRLILLDLHMPKIDGVEALHVIKEHPAFKVIPVIMISNSDIEENVNKAYKNGANSFIKKPLEYDTLLSIVKSLEEYWFNISSTPKI